MLDALSTSRRRLLAGLAASVVGLGLLPQGLIAQEAPEVAEMAMGAEDAPVTVVEYASLTCPHCASFHAEVLPRLKENFIDTGDVRLVFREVYFDAPGLWASILARCAGPERYFGVVDLLFQRQAEWARAGTPEAVAQELFAIGRQAGLSDEEMNACLSDEAQARALVAAYQENADADGIEATPTFLVNGEKLANVPYAEFEARLNQELGR